MESWYRSDVTHAHMEGLVKRGLLRGRTNAMEWLVLDHEEVLMPPDGYIVSFAPLPGQATTPQSQRDPSHCGLYRDVRGVPEDRATL